MASSSDDSDQSDAEKSGFRDRALEELQNGKRHVTNPDGTFNCPFCPKKKKQSYHHKDLLQHATGVGKSSSDKRSPRQKAEHLSLAEFLAKNPAAGDSAPPKPSGEFNSAAGAANGPLKPSPGELEEKIVCPWIGIVVNIPTRLGDDGRFVGESGSKLRDELILRGFNPVRVRPLWNFRGRALGDRFGGVQQGLAGPEQRPGLRPGLRGRPPRQEGVARRGRTRKIGPLRLGGPRGRLPSDQHCRRAFEKDRRPQDHLRDHGRRGCETGQARREAHRHHRRKEQAFGGD